MEIYWCIDCGKSFIDPTMTCDICGGWCDHDEIEKETYKLLKIKNES